MIDLPESLREKNLAAGVEMARLLVERWRIPTPILVAGFRKRIANEAAIPTAVRPRRKGRKKKR